MQKIELAVCQNKPGSDKKQNIDTVLKMIDEAVSAGADFILLPEIFYYVYELKKIRGIAEENRETLSILREAAARHRIYICTGSMAEKVDDKIYNRAYLVNPGGDVILEYSKSHLFDVQLPDLVVRESSVFTPGDRPAVVSTPVGNIGILICYDIRFPETARELAEKGAEIILVPAAFNTITGPAHWHITFRTRAVENQCFVAAASPARNNRSAYKAYGHSMIIDPWGTVLAEAGIDEKIISSTLEPGRLVDTRARLPLLKSIGL